MRTLIVLTCLILCLALGLLMTMPTYAQNLTPKTPAKKIIVLEFSLLDDLLQLGIKPYAIASSRSDEGTNPPFLLDQIRNLPEVGTRQQPNLEKLSAMKPDLIIADQTMQADIYPLLKEIAPTLLLNGLLGNIETQIKNLKILADATGKQQNVDALAKELKKEYERAVQLGKQHPSRVIIGYASYAGEFQALTDNALTSTMLKAFSHPNLIKVTRKEQSTPLPMESLLALDPDSLIILLTDGNRQPYLALTKHPLWQELRAVKTKHVYFMDRDIWAKNHGILATRLLIKNAIDSGFLTNQINKDL